MEALDDIDEELLELADGTTKLATMGALLGLSEADLSERIDRLSHLGFLDGDADESNSCCTAPAPDAVRHLGRAWAIDTLVDAAPPKFEDD